MSLDLYEQETSERMGRLTPVQRPEPGAFDGFLRGTGQTAMQTFAKTGRAASLALAAPIAAVEKAGEFGPWGKVDTTMSDRFFRFHDEVFQSAAEHWTPNPDEVGVAGQVVGQLLATIPTVIASPVATVAGTGLSVAEDLSRKGVDTVRSVATGATQAAGLGLGIWLPILGQNLWQRVVVGGMAANAAQGVLTRAVSGAILEGTPAAKDFEAFDGTALTLDVLLGAAFGGVTHLSPAQRAQGAAAWQRIREWAGSLEPSQVDAIAGLRQAQHLNVDSAPGVPVAARDIDAHVTRMRTAIDQLARDEPVSVENMPAARVEPRPDAAEGEARARDLVNEAERIRQEEGLPKPDDIRSDGPPGPEPGTPPRAEEPAVPAVIRDEPDPWDVDPQPPRTESAALTDEQVRGVVSGMRSEIGFDDRGGRVIIDEANRDRTPGAGDVLGRTVWTGQRWWFERPDASLTADQARTAIDKFLEGKRLGARQQRFIDYMQEIAHLRYGEEAGAPAIRGDVSELELHLASKHPRVEFVFQEHPTGVVEVVDYGLADQADSGKGLGDTAMRELTVWADRNGRELMLMAQPNRGSNMPLEKLVELYERHDFKRSAEQPYEDAVMMERLPNESANRSQGTQRSAAETRDAGLARDQETESRGERETEREVEGRGERATEEVDPLALETERIAVERPDLAITIGEDADGNPIRQTVADYLQGVREQTARAQEDVRLFEVAAACMLGRG